MTAGREDGGLPSNSQLRSGLELEEQLLPLWREMLASPHAASDDNFFECGGTSILAARLASRLSARLECRVTAADILSHPSARLLSRKLSGKEADLDRDATSHRAAMQRSAFAVRKPARAVR